MIETDVIPKKRTEGWKIRQVKRFLKANPESSIAETVNSTRASTSTVLRARREMLEMGELAPAARGRPPQAASPLESPVDDAAIRADIDAAIRAGKPALTRDERRARLSAYADSIHVPTAQKIAALKELEATEPPSEGATLGPGPPLTTADRIFRVSLMIERLKEDGLPAVHEAIERAGLWCTEGTWDVIQVGVDPNARPDEHPAPVDDPVPPEPHL